MRPDRDGPDGGRCPGGSFAGIAVRTSKRKQARHSASLTTIVPGFVNKEKLCNQREMLNHTGVDSHSMLVWRPHTKVQSSGCAARAGS
jgi:hypothetical protein